MGRSKKFIEKGEGVKFHLVHRSQRDPLFLDETLGEHVLVPVEGEENVSKELVNAISGLNLKGVIKNKVEREELRLKRVEEQQKYGIYYDDEYDYMQHLKDVDDLQDSEMDKNAEMVRVGSVLIKKSEEDDDEDEEADEVASTSQESVKHKLQLPSSVFASKFEEEVGFFNQAAPDNDPKINWDPDIVKLLDEDAEIDPEDPDNDLDDDFFVKANQEETVTAKTSRKQKSSRKADHDDDDDDEDEEDDDEDEDSDDSNGHFDHDEDDEDYESQSLKEFETKSRFSEYSMTSSVIRRNEQLQLIDEHFEKFYAQYDEEQIGALDTDDIEGFCNTNDLLFEAALKDFNKLMKKRTLELDNSKKPKSDLATLTEERSDLDGTEEADEDTLEEEETDDDDDESDSDSGEDGEKKEYETVRFKSKKSKEDRFDCESILSTYSSLYNRPTVISEKSSDDKIKISKKTGLPVGVLPEKPKGKKELERLDHQITKVVLDVPTRKPDETKEEKKARKQAIKEQRRERRIEKKINKEAFKKEKSNQLSQMANNRQMATSLKLPL